ncbi:DUF1672 family protein [Staphylococcus aureus]
MALYLMQVYLCTKMPSIKKDETRSNDNGDDMSMMVGTVLSGFQYRAQKEKYDNLYKFFKENEKEISIYRLYKRGN